MRLVVLATLSLASACQAESQPAAQAPVVTLPASTASSPATPATPARQARAATDERDGAVAAAADAVGDGGTSAKVDPNRETALSEAAQFGMLRPWDSADGGAQGLSLGGARAPDGGRAAPKLREGPIVVTGKLPNEVIKRIVRQNFGRFRLCYEGGLRTDASLAGDVFVRFTIDAQGAITNVSATSSTTLPDSGVVGCVVRAFGNLSFPQPDAGTVDVVYAVGFAPQ